MRKEDSAEGFENTLGFEFGFEKSGQEVMEISGEYRIDYFSSQGFHSFLVLKYENGYEKELSKKNTIVNKGFGHLRMTKDCLLYTSPSPRDRTRSRMPSSA